MAVNIVLSVREVLKNLPTLPNEILTRFNLNGRRYYGSKYYLWITPCFNLLVTCDVIFNTNKELEAVPAIGLALCSTFLTYLTFYAIRVAKRKVHIKRSILIGRRLFYILLALWLAGMSFGIFMMIK